MQKEIKKNDTFKAWMVKDAFFDGKYEFPEIGSNSEELPNAVIPFNKALSSSEYERWVHFYIHDLEYLS